MESNLGELESLLLDWENGELDDAGIERVREILRNDAEARTFYLQHQMIGAALCLEGDAGLMPLVSETLSPVECRPCVSKTQGRSTRPRKATRLWVAIAVGLLFCVAIGRLAYLEFVVAPDDGVELAVEPSKVTHPQSEPVTQGVALVTNLVDVEWNAQQESAEVGDALAPGRFAFDSGLAQIEFFCGATVIVEGPAEIELVTPMLARVHSGRLCAHVPPAARGFSMEVADMRVVDLGTEFGLAVTSEGADVQVFDGEIELHHADNPSRLLTAGEAIARSKDGDLHEADVTPEKFVDIATFEAQANLQEKARFERWKQWSEQLRHDPRLIAYYPFDQKGHWDRKLPNAVEPENLAFDGAIVGASRVAGRWRFKSALQFKRPGDRVRVDIPGEFGSMTFACWVRIDSLDRRFNSLFLTDGYNPGEPHWQILDTGQLSFSRRTRAMEEVPMNERSNRSPSFWEPSMSGKWIHLASSFDQPSRTVAHYLNGELLSRTTIDERLAESPTRIGGASIANWGLPSGRDVGQPIRNLNGSIDEFIIFSAALSGSEVQEMYRIGKP